MSSLVFSPKLGRPHRHRSPVDLKPTPIMLESVGMLFAALLAAAIVISLLLANLNATTGGMHSNRDANQFQRSDAADLAHQIHGPTKVAT